MTIFDALKMILGLALFLYGMHAMGEGLAKIAGGKLEKILATLTNNPIKGIMLGALVTAIIQSSSATTVMVVGFVNSSIMNLGQAVNIIMGANVGTTVTSWILSLSGVSGDNLLVQLLKPVNFSPIVASIGVYLLIFQKKEKRQDIGSILVGFAILMVGMHTMSDAVKPLANVPQFTSILTAFKNPILGLFVGALFTAIIQSSSASVGILQALCLSNAISYASALPIIMGQNIGTCVTALISSIGANKNAKRAAMIHLYFNLIGTILFMIAFYSLDSLMQFAFLDKTANVFGIAMIHTVFNISASIVLMPFGKQLVKLAKLTIPDSVADSKQPLVDPRFMETPGVAVEQCLHLAKEMATMSSRTLDMSLSLLHNYDEETAVKAKELERSVDKYQDELGTYLIKLSRKDLSRHDSHSVSIMLYCLNDFERISDYAMHVKKIAKQLNDKEVSFSKEAIKEIDVYTDAIHEIVSMTKEVFNNEDIVKAHEVEPLEQVIDQLSFDLKLRHVARLTNGTCSQELDFVISDLITSLERISDHCSNIAACIIEVRQDTFELHEYTHNTKKNADQTTKQFYEAFQRKYQLPNSMESSN